MSILKCIFILDDLPEGWEKISLGTGKFYYHDMINDHVQWDPPSIGIFLLIVDKVSSVIVFQKISKDS